jgi:Holliday junction DNA helicase RuvA
MIAKIKGQILDKFEEYLIIETGGIGYKIFVTEQVLERTKKGSDAEFYTHLIVRENILDLYGFYEKDEIAIFELLLAVSGIGPKGALGVLSEASPSEIQTSIVNSDYSILTKVSGIGQKTAERIVLELKNKIGKLSIKSSPNVVGRVVDLDVIEALETLGYSSREVKEVVKKIDPKISETEIKIKLALQLLGRK